MTRPSRKIATSPPTPLRARIYARDSLDKSGKRASPARQIELARDLIRARGWIEVSDPIVDSSMKASNQRTTTRPGYIAFVDAMMRGEFDVPVAHHDDRLWRTIAEREAFMWAASDAAIPFVATCYGDFQVGHADDDFRGELNVMLSKREAATIARRMRDAHVVKRGRGEWPGGPAPYGYQLDSANKSLAIEPAEKAVVREGVDRLLAGESQSSIVADWQRRGIRLRPQPEHENNRGEIVPARDGKPWSVRRLAQVVSRPALRGLVANRTGDSMPAKWDAIIEPDEAERLDALYAARRTGPRHSTASKNVLARYLRCGLCGAALHISSVKGVGRYECPPSTNGGCRKVGVGKAKVEAHVLDEIVKHMDSPEFAAEIERAANASTDARLEGVAKQIAQDRTQLGLLADMLADGDIDRQGYKRGVARLDDRIARNEKLLAGSTSSVGPALGLVGQGQEVRTEWENPAGYTFAERRQIIEALIVQIDVLPVEAVGGQRGVWDPRRVEIEWRFAKPTRRRRTAQPAVEKRMRRG